MIRKIKKRREEMPEEISAFLNKKTPCPVCGEETVQKKLQSRFYSPAEQESDQHVVRWNWTDPRFEGIKPQYYQIMHCPICYYTDLAADYETPSNDPKFNGIKKLYQILKSDRKEFLKKLSPYIFVHPMTFESTVNAHLAALYVQQIPEEKEYKNLTKLGRLYLRTGWLWREKNPSSKSGSSSVLQDIERSLSELEKPFHETQERMENLNNWLFRRIKSFNLSPQEEAAHPYQLVLKELRSDFNLARQTLGKLSHLLELDASGNLASAKENNTYAGFQNYFDFLAEMMKTWSEIPLNEKECLTMASRYFTDSYFTELNFDEVEKVLAMSSLIVDLHLRLKDYDSALKAISSVYKAGMDGKMALQKEMREKKKENRLSEKDQMTIESKISRIEHVIQKTSEKRSEIKNLKLQSFLPQIQSALSKGNENPELKLQESGIPEDVIETYLNEKNDEAEKSIPEKRSLFSLFGRK